MPLSKNFGRLHIVQTLCAAHARAYVYYNYTYYLLTSIRTAREKKILNYFFFSLKKGVRRLPFGLMPPRSTVSIGTYYCA